MYTPVAMLIFFAYGAALSTLIAVTTLHTIEWSDEVISIYYIHSSVFFPNAVKNKGDLTSDDPISDAVETTAAEPVLTDCKETKEG